MSESFQPFAIPHPEGPWPRKGPATIGLVGRSPRVFSTRCRLRVRSGIPRVTNEVLSWLLQDEVRFVVVSPVGGRNPHSPCCQRCGTATDRLGYAGLRSTLSSPPRYVRRY